MFAAPKPPDENGVYALPESGHHRLRPCTSAWGKAKGCASGQNRVGALVTPLPRGYKKVCLPPPSSAYVPLISQGEKHWVEEIAAPEAVPNSGTLTVTVGVGRFPAVREAGERALQFAQTQRRRRGWVDTEGLLVAALLPEVYRTYLRETKPDFLQVWPGCVGGRYARGGTALGLRLRAQGGGAVGAPPQEARQEARSGQRTPRARLLNTQTAESKSVMGGGIDSCQQLCQVLFRALRINTQK